MKTSKLFTIAAVAALPLIGVAAEATHEVVQKDKAFSVPEMTVNKGETITFKNNDAVVHNVFSATPGLEFDLRTQQPGHTSDVKFDKPGDCEVRCAIHPKMKMIVHVKE